MFKRRNSNLFSKLFLNQYLILIIILILLLLLSIPLARNVSKKYEIDSEVQALEDEIAGLQKKNNELEKMIDNYSSNDFVEEVARLNLGLKKEGEEVLVVKKKEEKDEKEIVFSGDIKFAGDKAENNSSKWLRYFLRK